MRRFVAFAMMIGLVGCASHKQLRCRWVAVDGRGNVNNAHTSRMHSHWHRGFGSCAAMIQLLENGTIEGTITGDEAGVEVKGGKSERLRLKRFFDTEPMDGKGLAMVRKPSFKKMMEVAE